MKEFTVRQKPRKGGAEFRVYGMYATGACTSIMAVGPEHATMLC